MGILKIPRITEAQRTTVGFIPEVGELLYVTTNKKIYKGDGTTAGGIEVAGGTGGGIEYTTTTGTANTYTATIAGVSSYVEGDIYAIKFNVTNTGASTLQINSLTPAKTIVKNANTALEADDILANKIYILVYDGTNFQLVTLGGGGATGAAGGDLSGTYPNPTVDGLQGNPVSNATPYNGQVLQFDGTSWVPGAIPTGGSGGGGVFYYFNYQNTTGITPTTGLPTTPVAPSQLGITYNAISNSINSANLTQGVYTLVCGFVTIVGTPGVTTIPAGLWDFNIWADVVGATGGSNQTQFQIRVYKYNGSTAPTLLASSDDIYVYDPTVLAQYIGNVTMPQTTILNTDRIYIEFWAQKNVSQSRQVSFHFGTNTPSHVHTTIPSVAGTGLVKVVNGVFQSPASTLVNADVASDAAIVVTKLAGSGNNILISTSGTTSWSTSLPAITIPSTGSLTLGLAGPSGNTGQILFRNSATANTVTLQPGATSTTYTITLPTTPSIGAQYLQTTSSGGELQWANGTTTGVTGVGTLITSTPSKSLNGAVIIGANLFMQTADTTRPGLVSTGDQSFAGNKTFTQGITVSSITTPNSHIVLLGSTSGNSTTIASTNAGGAKTYTIPNVGATGTFLMNTGNQLFDSILKIVQPNTSVANYIDLRGLDATGSVDQDPTGNITHIEGVTTNFNFPSGMKILFRRYTTAYATYIGRGEDISTLLFASNADFEFWKQWKKGITFNDNGIFLRSSTSALQGVGATMERVIGPRIKGWQVTTGTNSRATYVTYTTQTISSPPTQAQVQAINNHLVILSQRLGALINDLHATAGHGLIGFA